MKNRLFIQAMNVHTGGGAYLLKALLDVIPSKLDVCLMIDARFKLNSKSSLLEVQYVSPTIFSRLKAEWAFAKKPKKGEEVLCFGNLPPLFKNRGRVSLFLQNRYLIDKNPLKGFSIKTKLRLIVERFWLRYFKYRVDQFIVQTQTMERLLKSTFGTTIPIKVLPFVDVSLKNLGSRPGISENEKKYDFIYPASGEPHKNHRRLIMALSLLADEGVRPSLCLTLDNSRSKRLLTWVETQKKLKNLSIFNKPVANNYESNTLCCNAKAMIYPSLLESFGVPLFVASMLRIPVIAGELDYIRDIINPAETFDPASDVSIARAMKRFLNVEPSVKKILHPKEFLLDFLFGCSGKQTGDNFIEEV